MISYKLFVELEKRIAHLEKVILGQVDKWWQTDDHEKRNKIINTLTLKDVKGHEVKIGDLLVFDDPLIGKWVQEVVVIYENNDGLWFYDHLPEESGGGIGQIQPDETLQRIAPS